MQRTYAQPDALAAYTPTMVGRVAASRGPLADYRAAVAAFNAAPNETGYAIPDRSGALAAALDELETVDRQPETLAAALRSVDVLRWAGVPLAFSLSLLRHLFDRLPEDRLREVVAQLHQARLAQLTGLLRDAAALPPDVFAERADELAAAFAWVADAGVEHPEVLEAVFGDWGPAEVEGLLANLSRYASEQHRDGIAPGDPDAIERLLDPVARALGAATTAGALDAAAVQALTGGGACAAGFDGFDDAFHVTQGRLLLLGHADDFSAEVAAGLAHHAITAEPVLVDHFEREMGLVDGIHATPATFYLDHRHDARLDELAGGQRPPLTQALTTYALLAVEGWTSGPNEAAFRFLTDVPAGTSYHWLLGDDVNAVLAGGIIAEGLGRFPAHSPDPADAAAAHETLAAWVQTFGAEDRGRWYAMPDALRQGLAVAIASDPDTLEELVVEGSLTELEGAGALLVELLRDDTAAVILFDGVRGLQAERLAQVLDGHVDAGVVDLDAQLSKDDRNALTGVGYVYQYLDRYAAQAGVADELRGDLVGGVTSVLLGLVPKVPVKGLADGGGLVLDFVRLEEELAALGDERAEGISRVRGAELLLLAHTAESQPALLEDHLDADQQEALDAALAHDDPAQRQQALDEVWGELAGTDVRALITSLVRESSSGP